MMRSRPENARSFREERNAVVELAVASDPSRRVPAYVALDLGTSSCRMLAAVPAAGGFRVVDSFSRVVRLGEGLMGRDQLGAAAMERAAAALRACAERIARRPVRAVWAIATEACRRAANGPEFLRRVRAETGLRIEVITARQEAELALESCAPLLDPPHEAGERRALLFDIGGGSTELAWVRLEAGTRPALIGTVSLPVGVVTMADRFGAAGFDAHGFEAMVAEVLARLLPFERTHRIAQELRRGGVRLLGTSGTVTTLAGVALGLPRYQRPLVDGQVLTDAVAAAALASLRALGRDGLCRHPCVGSERAELVLPGCAVFEAIRRTWPAASVTVADRGLREGMITRMMRDGVPGRRLPARRAEARVRA